MSEKIKKEWAGMGVLDINSNKVLKDSSGARELTNIADLQAHGHLELLPGFSHILDAPMLADYTTGTVTVSNGSKAVTGSGTVWLFGSAGELVTTGDMSSSTGWTLAAPWSIGSGVATRTASASNTTLVNAFAPTVGLRYNITYTLTRTAGTVTVSCGGYSRAHSASGTTTDATFIATTTAALTFTADASFEGTVDNVSVHVEACNAFRGDLFIGPDGEYYEVADVTSNGGLSLTTEYAGADASGGSYTMRHKVWMLAPFTAQFGDAVQTVTKSQSYQDTAEGTFAGTESIFHGTVVTKTSYASTAPSGNIAPNDTSNQLTAGSGWTYTHSANRFQPTTTHTGINGVYCDCDTMYASETYKVHIFNDNGLGKPGTAVASSATITRSVQIAKTTESIYYYPFVVGNKTFTSGVTYHIVFESVSGTVYPKNYDAAGTSTGIANNGVCNRYNGSAWYSVTGGYHWVKFAFISYPTAAKTYVGPVFNLGFTPTAAPSLTITQSPQYDDYFYLSNFALPVTFTPGTNTMTWKLESSASADMSAPTEVATGQTALTYSIGTLARYYRLTYTLTSGDGSSTPIVSSASIYANSTIAGDASGTTKADIVGCGANVYTSIGPAATTINTSNSPGIMPAMWTIYNQNFFYRHSGTRLRYWNAISTADALVKDMTKTDGSAGTDPPERAMCLVSHNDKLITGGNVGLQYATGASTTITETALTNSGAAFTTTGTGMIGWRLAPDNSWIPEQWFTITSNTGTVATCSGSELVTDGHADLGDTYLIMRFYPKTLFYSTEAEPADFPSTNFIYFNAADGDEIRQVISHNGNLLVICESQVWGVRGYGPSTPWEKQLISKSGGTIAPMSAVSTAYDVFWWSDEGIVRCAGGTGVPEIVDNEVRDITIDNINPLMKHNIVGVLHKGCIYWSYPSADSNINDTTIVLDATTRRWAKYSFGMYAPASIAEPTGTSELKFWEPTSGCMSKVNEDVFTFGGSVEEFAFATAFMACTDPTEMAQWLFARVVLIAGQTFTATVSASYDYGDTYADVGTLVPIDTVSSGRTSVNATDRIYICRFPVSVRGASVSLRITGSTSAALKILQLSVIADPVEYGTYK